MKKLSVILILVMFALIVKAGGEATSYVTANGKTYFCQDVKSGLFNMRLKLADGTTMKIPINKVDAWSSNGKMYERLPLMCPDAPANCTALMQYVTSRNGFRLYKYCKTGECGDLWSNTYKKAHNQLAFFVYKDGRFYLPVNQENASSVLPFFGVEVTE